MSKLIKVYTLQFIVTQLYHSKTITKRKKQEEEEEEWEVWLKQ
jgi:hypothetical protein